MGSVVADTVLAEVENENTLSVLKKSQNAVTTQS